MTLPRKLRTTLIVTFAMLSGSGELFAKPAADSPVELVRRVAQTEIAVSNGNGQSTSCSAIAGKAQMAHGPS